MFKKQYLVYLLIINISAFAQVGGQSTYAFLNLISAPRQAALGGKTITNYDYDVNQPLFNPATINQKMSNKLGINYVSYLSDINYGSINYAHTFDQHIQTFHLGVTYINYGKFDGRDTQGNTTGSFTGNEAAIALSYAYNIPRSKVHFGASIKPILSVLENYKSFGLASDMGLLYADTIKKTNLALVVKNIGTQVTTYNGVSENLPLEIIAGVSHQLENLPVAWHITLENLQQWQVAFSNPARNQETIDAKIIPEKVNFLDNAFRHVIIGAEILPQKSINFRVSYNFRRSAELKIIEQRNFAGFSAGFGIAFQKFRFDYSYSRYSLATNSSQFGLILNL